MNLNLKVLQKQKVETGKGYKYALKLGDKKGDSLTILVDEEEQLDAYEINDSISVKVSRAQQQLPVQTGEEEKEEAENILKEE
jgi:hypothetical protein